ncbi:LPXTG cell wall anchor domain-containing protein [Enterococcus faecium]|nr:LPXTG cell wall anchor domain-containing protein [Enterococcus faecium]EME8125137.1 LPXTG cell wall anchor domain-containing protein [Enterococcus faecium]
MKRMRRLIVLSILSLFLGVTTVTSYAESNTVSVEAGIQFVEDSGSHSESEASNEKPSNGGENTSQSEQGTSTTGLAENTETLPKTGENHSIMFLIVGILLVQLTMLYIVIRTQSKERRGQ